MFSPKIKLDKSLYDRLTAAAKRAGYATTDEFIRHVLEKTAAHLEEAASDEEVEKQLRGLGYIE
jgi:metal-responsive CopG/Arc/MetJ family transcriptional regulator